MYWPVKLRETGRVLFFRLQLWDCGENTLRRFDHLFPVCVKSKILSFRNRKIVLQSPYHRSASDQKFCKITLPFVFQSCQEQVDAVLFLFSFADRTSFEDLSNQITKWNGTSLGCVVKLVVGTKYPLCFKNKVFKMIKICLVDTKRHLSLMPASYLTFSCTVMWLRRTWGTSRRRGACRCCVWVARSVTGWMTWPSSSTAWQRTCGIRTVLQLRHPATTCSRRQRCYFDTEGNF